MASSAVVRPALHHALKSSRSSHICLSFLIPYAIQVQTSSFSTSTTQSFPRDNNRERGVSTVRRTGPRQPLSVSKEPLPTPVLDPKKRSKVAVDPDHGLWEFFYSKDKPINTPEEDNEHGRPWSVEELRHKSWEDLHALWWVCCKERNRIATESYERERLEAGYGAFEQKRRDLTVRRTQRAIKQVLTERWYSWDEARKIAREDSEVDLSGEGPAYTPSAFEEELSEDILMAAEQVEEETGTIKSSVAPLGTIQPSLEQRPSASN